MPRERLGGDTPLMIRAGRAALLTAAACVLASCGSSDRVTGPERLTVHDHVIGSGAMAVPGDLIVVHYVGHLTDGTRFDSSYDRGEPFTFLQGAREVIRGFDEGILGMRVGGLRRIVMPPAWGYGEAGTPGGPIPPNATLVFTIELVSRTPGRSGPVSVETSRATPTLSMAGGSRTRGFAPAS